jgi:hypothetical protein
MKYAIVHNGIVNNIVVAESKEVLEEFYPDYTVVEILEKEDFTSEENHIYVPHIGLGYSKDTGFEQPTIIENNEESEI